MKVAVLGAAGGIGQALALLLKTQLPSGSELSLYDIAPVTPGVAVDLSHIPTEVKIKGFAGEDATPALEGANVVLISAGVARKPGMDRSDLFNINAGIVRNLVEQVAKTCPKSLIGIITNPVNTTVAIAAEVLKKAGVYDKNRLFGVTTLDVIRSNTFVAELKGKKPQEIEVPVIGGHSGVTILPLLSQIPGVNFTDGELAALTKRIQNAGTEVVEAKAGGGSATLSMGQAAARLGLSLVRGLQGESDVVECAYVEGDGKYARFFAQPVRLGKNGVEERLNIGELSDFEQKALEGMLDVLRKDIELGEKFINN
ncbi:malate dehydrogenase [Photorhabdus laumondii subsp. laumondii]|uniref:Malate dehydrogenase n=2 Tax=Photorhabdus laumondii subsp. laumondii TaxID=141679 RepID=MDH_PHOLL|nr:MULTISPECIES: malate dehydrogenase [Photorhabdus]Q7MYW9.1 RecName: Full=Malate dehydrogenase [Photorhabdus laumondii subsp. laumondii TTO1]MCE1781576.1 malate dehydrogenase [Enterobacter hormaechei]AWK44074.1 malate dehydrogenase [Photorhabdus laumondii subsp. laumondii]AXG44755.1 malate dehydrogenase [Photorhabdus laumondii subsp. laumondii]AXG49391.1 malate dehydrogenase [Photorhabdus laumondii subsp. laumondii]KTL60147.1 malate dehydrogenase [Photorhabdus laumondii subsp. laumondii]